MSDRATTLPASTRYAIAVATALGGALLRLVLEPIWHERLPYITFFPGIMFSGWMGGFGPGMCTTILSAIVAAYFWVPPERSLWIAGPREWLGLVMFVAIGFVISVLNEAWRRGSLALAKSEQRLAVTLASIGDAVMTIDEDGRVTSMNEVAEKLTGWAAPEAVGRMLEDVFVIVHEGSCEPTPNPARQALRDGVVTELPQNTLLVSRDGRTTPIADSAAPIRLDGGRAAGAVMVFRDLTERRRTEAQKEAEDLAARELAAIVESSDDAIVSKDLESTVRSWNRGAERIFGYTAQEMIGRSIRTIIPEDRWSEEDDVLRQLRRGEKVDHFETVRQRKDGSLVPVSLTISPIYSPAGIVIGASKIARDITERKQVEIERTQLLAREQQARADLERASRLKDEFLAVLSHELRTPLNAVVGYTQLLLSGAVPADRTPQALQAIQRNAQAQARLVESLLDMSRVLAGKLELNLEDLRLSSVLEAAVDAVRLDAAGKGVALEVSDSSGAATVSGDASRLQQVFWNLLSNAVKFTPGGGRVTAAVTVEGANMRIRIVDNGRGIEPDLLPYVFDRFRQAKGEAARERGGLGLGLSLVREMVHAHGGTVAAESEGDGRGAVFTVTLPLAVSNMAEGTDTSGSPDKPEPTASNTDILIVDDERDARDMLGLILSTQGATVRLVSSAAEALEALTDRSPDVLLADLGMPGEDGYLLLRRWRAMERELGRKRVTAIAVTAYVTPKDRERAVSAGFDWHVAKPVDVDELVRIIAAAATPRDA